MPHPRIVMRDRGVSAELRVGGEFRSQSPATSIRSTCLHWSIRGAVHPTRTSCRRQLRPRRSLHSPSIQRGEVRISASPSREHVVPDLEGLGRSATLARFMRRPPRPRWSENFHLRDALLRESHICFGLIRNRVRDRISTCPSPCKRDGRLRRFNSVRPLPTNWFARPAIDG